MEHNWAILEEKILSDYLGEQGVISLIWFRLTTTEGDKKAKIDGRINLPIDQLDNFIPYEQVDLQTKVNWIKSHAGDFYENINIENINSQNI